MTLVGMLELELELVRVRVRVRVKVRMLKGVIGGWAGVSWDEICRCGHVEGLIEVSALSWDLRLGDISIVVRTKWHKISTQNLPNKPIHAPILLHKPAQPPHTLIPQPRQRTLQFFAPYRLHLLRKIIHCTLNLLEIFQGYCMIFDGHTEQRFCLFGNPRLLFEDFEGLAIVLIDAT